jgi:hypothetical protein
LLRWDWLLSLAASYFVLNSEQLRQAEADSRLAMAKFCRSPHYFTS